MTAISPLDPRPDTAQPDSPRRFGFPDDDIRIVEDGSVGEWDPLNLAIEIPLKAPTTPDALDPLPQARPAFVGTLGELVRQDLNNIMAGVYRAPYDSDLRADPLNSATVFDHVSGLLQSSSQALGSRDPCRDMVERQALVPLAQFMHARCQADTQLLEVGCGAGRLHAFIKDNYPLVGSSAVDPSAASLAEALLNLVMLMLAQRSKGRPAADPTFLVATPAELPFDRESFDVVVLRYALGALGRAEAEAAVEHACRVLRPGGQLIVLDHKQGCDFRLGASRPASVPDPYWRGNVGQWFEDAGLKFESCRYALEDKVLSFRKANIQERLAALIGSPSLGVELPLPRY
eukprot:EG_transcript_10757